MYSITLPVSTPKTPPLVRWHPKLEPSDAASHPTTEDDSPFFVNVVDQEIIQASDPILDTAEALFVSAMGAPIGDQLSVSINGRIEDGLYYPEYYQFEDDLFPGSWEDGMKAIEDFDWSYTALEDQQQRDEAVSDVRASTSPLDAPHSEVTPFDDEPLTSPVDAPVLAGNIEAEPLPASTVRESSPSTPVHRDEQSTSALFVGRQSSPDHHASEHLMSSSPPWIESPKPKGSIPLDAIPTSPPVQPDNDTGIDEPQSVPRAITEEVVDSKLTLSDEIIANDKSGSAPEVLVTTQPLPEQVVGSSEDMADTMDLDEQDEGRGPTGEDYNQNPARADSTTGNESKNERDNADDGAVKGGHDEEDGIPVTGDTTCRPSILAAQLAESTLSSSEVSAGGEEKSDPAAQEANVQPLPMDDVEGYSSQQHVVIGPHVSMSQPQNEQTLDVPSMTKAAPVPPATPVHVMEQEQTVAAEADMDTDMMVPFIEEDAADHLEKRGNSHTEPLASIPKQEALSEEPASNHVSGEYESASDVKVVAETEMASSKETKVSSSARPEKPATSLKLKVNSKIWNEATPASQNRNEGDGLVFEASATEHVEGGSSVASEERPRPLLQGIEEAAAAVASPSSTIAAESIRAASPTPIDKSEGELSSPWAGTLLEQQLDLPPSPFEAARTAESLPEEQGEAEPDVYHDAEDTQADAVSAIVRATSPVRQKVTEHKESNHEEGSTRDETPDAPEALSTATTEALAPEAAQKKRARSTTTKKTKAATETSVEYSPSEASESEYGAPAKKRQRKGAPVKATVKSARSQAPATTPRRKGATKPTAQPKRQRATKAKNRASQEVEPVDRADVDILEEDQVADDDHTPSAGNNASPPASKDWPISPYETKHGKRRTRSDPPEQGETPKKDHADTHAAKAAAPGQHEEMLVDAESDAGTTTPASAPKTRGRGRAKAQPATRKTPARPKATPKAKAPAPADSPNASNKYGFKTARAGRKRKTDDSAADVAQVKTPKSDVRQTRQAKAQEEQDSSVAKRTRGAQKK